MSGAAIALLFAGLKHWPRCECLLRCLIFSLALPCLPACLRCPFLLIAAWDSLATKLWWRPMACPSCRWPSTCAAAAYWPTCCARSPAGQLAPAGTRRCGQIFAIFTRRNHIQGQFSQITHLLPFCRPWRVSGCVTAPLWRASARSASQTCCCPARWSNCACWMEQPRCAARSHGRRAC